MNNAIYDPIILKHIDLINKSKSKREHKIRIMRANLDLKRLGYSHSLAHMDQNLSERYNLKTITVENNKKCSDGTENKVKEQIKVLVDKDATASKSNFKIGESMPFKALNPKDADKLGIDMFTNKSSMPSNVIIDHDNFKTIFYAKD